MIVIEKPVIKDNTLQCLIRADYLQDGKALIWFEVDKQYSKYLVSEVADAFLLACLLPAIRHGEDIVVRCAVDEKLLFHLRYSVSFMLATSYSGKRINIKVDKTVQTNWKGTAVGCGCSLGVDSLSAIFTHHPPHTYDTPNYQITHLTYFNVGSHGYKNAEANHKSYLNDMVNVDKFANMVGLPVVKIESNIWELFNGFNFDQSGNLINMSTVLTMQKLFGKYLYGSNYPMTATHFTDVCSGYFESLMIPVVSTDSTELIVANADMSRSQKTEVVIKYPLSKNFLYVCWKELIVNNNPNHPIALIKDNYLNCTRCDKCLRTCMQLDILGVLDEYNEIFDIAYFRKVKDNYLGKCIAYKRQNEFYRDIVAMAFKFGYRIPLKSRLIAITYKSHFMGIYNRFKSIIHQK